MARPAERFVETLTEEEREQLSHLWKHHEKYRVRLRAHAVLLSSQGFPIKDLCVIFQVGRPTISAWLRRWQESRFEGFEDEDHPRCPPKLDEDEQALARELIKRSPRQPNHVLDQIEQRTGKRISRRTLRRIAKAAGLVWKRMRRSLAFWRDEEDFAQGKTEVDELRRRHAEGEIDLYFFDESSFSMTPVVPYAWQFPGETIEIPSSRGDSIQTLGFMNPEGELEPYCVHGAVNAEIVELVMDDFASKISRPSVVVLDNASVHTADLIEQKREEWADQGVRLHYLPPYCPELNLIERLWEEIKYRWLPLEAYRSFSNLEACLNDILSRIGDDLRLEFSAK